MAVQKRVDVVTVGAGWAGGIMALYLTKAGLNVLSLEQGTVRWANPDFLHNHDPLRFHVRHALMVDLAQETWTWRPNPQAPTLPMRRYGSFNPGAGLGGAGVHWAAQTWRFLPFDFRYRSHHIERYGQQKLGNSLVQDWPVSYDDLEPFYDQFEYDIGVSGQVGNLAGQVIDGGNVFEGPRRRPFPLPPLTTTIPADIFATASRALGYHPFPQPSAITSTAYTDPFGNLHSGCIYCGYCTRYGCEVDAKASAVNTHIPAALKTGRYTIAGNAKVVRINVDSAGRATGVTYIDANGQEQEQPADIVILSAFTLSNVRLLLLSKSAAHPNGVGNSRGLVGKHYTYQLSKTPVAGVFEGRRFNQYMGNSCTINVLFDYYGDVFDHKDQAFIGGARIMCGSGERDPQTSVGAMPIGVTATSPGSNGLSQAAQNWGQPWKDDMRKNWDGVVGITFEGDILPYDDQYLDLDPVYKDKYGLPLLRLTFDFHQNEKNLFHFIATKSQEIMQKMNPNRISAQLDLSPYNIYEYQSTHCTGGAIMGSDPGNSVTNKYGQVWDTPNVFVTGAALFPQNPGANPTGTVCALSYWAGDAIRSQYIKAPNQLMT